MFLQIVGKKLHGKIVALMAVFSMTAMSFSACSFSMDNLNIGGNPATPEVEEIALGMEETPVFNYEMPAMQPGIIVDKKGYSTLEQKYAWIVSSAIPGSFSVLDTKSGKEVYTGEPSDYELNEETGNYIIELFFGDLQETGSYVISVEGMGKSCEFDISDTHFGDIFDEMVITECSKCKDMSATEWEVYMLIYTYERYKDVIIDDSDIDVMEAIKEWISKTDFDSAKGKTALINVAILAKFAYNYSTTDIQLSNECIQKAVAIYKNLAVAEEANDERFLALAELYRTSSEAEYGREIEAMADYLEGLEHPHDSRYILYGSMSYMTTRKYVNKALCDKLMNEMLYECEDNNKDKLLLHPVNGDTQRTSNLLVYAQQFEVLNYILDGYEYNEKIVSIIHFLSGRNSEGYICDIEGDYPSDGLVIYAWLALLEKNGKLDPKAPVEWQYSW